MKHLLLFSLALCLVFSCAKKDSMDEARTVYQQSMAIHDEIMPYMDELLMLKQRLQQKEDSLKFAGARNSVAIQQVTYALEQLAQADKAMMDWMHHIKDIPGEDEPGGHQHHGHHQDAAPPAAPDQILVQQKEQKAAIDQLRKDMEQSMATAREVLNNR